MQAADEAGLELNMELPGAAEQTIGRSFTYWCHKLNNL
jgi:hypothetical protein